MLMKLKRFSVGSSVSLRVQIPWCQAVEVFEHQYAEFERDAFPCTQPVQTITE